jgi:hypothetical protein
VSIGQRESLIYTGIVIATGFSPRFDVALRTGSRKRDQCSGARPSTAVTRGLDPRAICFDGNQMDVRLKPAHDNPVH